MIAHVDVKIIQFFNVANHKNRIFDFNVKYFDKTKNVTNTHFKFVSVKNVNKKHFHFMIDFKNLN